MKIKGFIEDEATIKKTLKKLNLWNAKNLEPPPPNDAYNTEYESMDNGEDSYDECSIYNTFDEDIDCNCDIYPTPSRSIPPLLSKWGMPVGLWKLSLLELALRDSFLRSVTVSNI